MKLRVKLIVFVLATIMFAGIFTVGVNAIQSTGGQQPFHQTPNFTKLRSNQWDVVYTELVRICGPNVEFDAQEFPYYFLMNFNYGSTNCLYLVISKTSRNVYIKCDDPLSINAYQYLRVTDSEPPWNDNEYYFIQINRPFTGYRIEMSMANSLITYDNLSVLTIFTNMSFDSSQAATTFPPKSSFSNWQTPELPLPGGPDIDFEFPAWDYQIPTAPDRNDFPEGIVGDFLYGLLLIVWPLQVLGSFILYLFQWLVTFLLAFVKNFGKVGDFFQTFFYFMPTPFPQLIALLFVVFSVTLVVKMIRG